MRGNSANNLLYIRPRKICPSIFWRVATGDDECLDACCCCCGFTLADIGHTRANIAHHIHSYPVRQAFAFAYYTMHTCVRTGVPHKHRSHAVRISRNAKLDTCARRTRERERSACVACCTIVYCRRVHTARNTAHPTHTHHSSTTRRRAIRILYHIHMHYTHTNTHTGTWENLSCQRQRVSYTFPYFCTRANAWRAWRACIPTNLPFTPLPLSIAGAPRRKTVRCVASISDQTNQPTSPTPFCPQSQSHTETHTHTQHKHPPRCASSDFPLFARLNCLAVCELCTCIHQIHTHIYIYTTETQ